MKKLIVFLALSLLALSFFACGLQLPNEINIKGTPQLRFGAAADFSGMFSDMITDAFGEGEGNAVRMLHCENVPDTQTFLVHMIAVEEDFIFQIADINTSTKITIDGVDYDIGNAPGSTEISLDSDVPLFNSNASDDPINLPLSSFSNSGNTGGLDGFIFTNNVKAKLYFSGSEIINKTHMKIDFVPDGGSPINVKDSIAVLAGSNISPGAETFAGTALPLGGDLIANFHERINDGRDVTTHLEIYLPAAATIPKAMLGVAVKVKVELVIWFPLELEIANESAKIDFPGDLFGEVGSFISSLAESEAVEWLSLELQLEGRNPFENGELVMIDTANGITIVNPLGANSLRFEISKDDMRKILNAGNFSPKLSIRFHQGEIIKIPKEFRTAMVILRAGVNYFMEL